MKLVGPKALPYAFNPHDQLNLRSFSNHAGKTFLFCTDDWTGTKLNHLSSQDSKVVKSGKLPVFVSELFLGHSHPHLPVVWLLHYDGGIE